MIRCNPLLSVLTLFEAVNRRLTFNASLLTASPGQKHNASSYTNLHIFTSLHLLHIYRWLKFNVIYVLHYCVVRFHVKRFRVWPHHNVNLNHKANWIEYQHFFIYLKVFRDFFCWLACLKCTFWSVNLMDACVDANPSDSWFISIYLSKPFISGVFQPRRSK